MSDSAAYYHICPYDKNVCLKQYYNTWEKQTTNCSEGYRTYYLALMCPFNLSTHI